MRDQRNARTTGARKKRTRDNGGPREVATQKAHKGRVTKTRGLRDVGVLEIRE